MTQPSQSSTLVRERCVYCGEERSPDQFEDGLRCKLCAEQQDEPSLTQITNQKEPPDGR